MARRTIILKPGDYLTIRASSNGSSGYRPNPIQDKQGAVILPVKYISQHGPGARHAPGDCGPACVAMAIHYLTDEQPTVDEVARSGNVPYDATWSSLKQLATAARCFGLKARHIRPLTRQFITDSIDGGFPLLALVKYDVIQPDQPAKAHFVLIAGYTPDTVLYHDPYDQTGEFEERTWPQFLEALGSTSQTKGNAYDNHGMLFHV